MGAPRLLQEGIMRGLMDGIIFVILNAQVGIELGAFGWTDF